MGTLLVKNGKPGQRYEFPAKEIIDAGFRTGRVWPLLTGERGHYEFAAGRDVAPYLRALEGFANSSGLLPEQVWQAPAPFRLRWSQDEWETVQDTSATATALNIHFMDIPVANGHSGSIRFTFFWTDEGRWEHRDYQIDILNK